MIRGVKTPDTRNGTLHKRVLISTAVNRLKAGKDFAHRLQNNHVYDTTKAVCSRQ